MPALLALVEPDERGDPMSPLRWTTKSLRHSGRGADPAGASGLGARRSAGCCGRTGSACRPTPRRSKATSTPTGMPSSATSTSRSSTIRPRRAGDQRRHEEEGTARPAARPQAASGAPGATGAGRGPQLLLHRPDVEQAIPYGIYDMTADTGWVNVGVDHDTAAFAVASIRRWWQARGRADYPHATRLLITADAGGSNGYRYRAWKSRTGRAWPPRRAWRSPSAISRRAPPSGTRSSTGCSPTSP